MLIANRVLDGEEIVNVDLEEVRILHIIDFNPIFKTRKFFFTLYFIVCRIDFASNKI